MTEEEKQQHLKILEKRKKIKDRVRKYRMKKKEGSLSPSPKNATNSKQKSSSTKKSTSSTKNTTQTFPSRRHLYKTRNSSKTSRVFDVVDNIPPISLPLPSPPINHKSNNNGSTKDNSSSSDESNSNHQTQFNETASNESSRDEDFYSVMSFQEEDDIFYFEEEKIDSFLVEEIHNNNNANDNLGPTFASINPELSTTNNNNANDNLGTTFASINPELSTTTEQAGTLNQNITSPSASRSAATSQQSIILTKSNLKKSSNCTDTDNGLGHLIHDKQINKDDLQKIVIQKRSNHVNEVEQLRKYQDDLNVAIALGEDFNSNQYEMLLSMFHSPTPRPANETIYNVQKEIKLSKDHPQMNPEWKCPVCFSSEQNLLDFGNNMKVLSFSCCRTEFICIICLQIIVDSDNKGDCPICRKRISI